jgi:hypothetical protein
LLRGSEMVRHARLIELYRRISSRLCHASASFFRSGWKQLRCEEHEEKKTMLRKMLITTTAIAAMCVASADIGAFWETYEAAKTDRDGKLETDQEGKMLTVRKQRAKLINDLPPEFRRLIEDVMVDRNGNVIPKLYSKAQANRDLREMLDIGARKEQETDDVSKLSDAELIQQLADTAKELGIEINLNYSFLQRNKPDEEPQG